MDIIFIKSNDYFTFGLAAEVIASIARLWNYIARVAPVGRNNFYQKISSSPVAHLAESLFFIVP